MYSVELPATLSVILPGALHLQEGNAIGQFAKGKDKKFFSWIVSSSPSISQACNNIG